MEAESARSVDILACGIFHDVEECWRWPGCEGWLWKTHAERVREWPVEAHDVVLGSSDGATSMCWRHGDSRLYELMLVRGTWV